MKKNLAIIGASYLQLPLILKAKEMGYVTHVFAWAANDIGEKEADYFYPISIVEKEKIKDKCKELNIVGICSIASDLAATTVNYVANELNLTSNSMAANEKCTNKYSMRNAFEANGDPSPKSILVNDTSIFDSLELKFPVIVKPTDRSGSRGIYKVENIKDLEMAIRLAMNESFEKKVLVEEYVDGQEYSVEYISYKGKHFFLAMTLKYTTGAPHFIETGHMQPAPVDDILIAKVQKVVEHALDTLEIKNGASHSEIKIAEDGTIKIIEIGGRMGGDCIGSDLVRYSTGMDFVRMVIQVACADEPDFSRVCEPRPVMVKFLLSQKDLNDFEKIKLENEDKLLRVVDFQPDNIGKTSDSSNRAGCYIYSLL